jgi:hypothetical protein
MRENYKAGMAAGLFAQPFGGSCKPPSFGTELSDVEVRMACLNHHRKNRLRLLLHRIWKRSSNSGKSNTVTESITSITGDIMQRGVFSSEKNKAQRANGYGHVKQTHQYQKHNGPQLQTERNEKQLKIAAKLRAKKGIIL